MRSSAAIVAALCSLAPAMATRMSCPPPSDPAGRQGFCSSARHHRRGNRPPNRPTQAPTAAPTGQALWRGCPPGSGGYVPPSAIAAQPDGFPYTPEATSAAALPASSGSVLLRLTRISPTDCSAVVVGRSYGGEPWEGVRPDPVQLVPAGCGGGDCTIDAAAAGPFGTYRVDAYRHDANLADAADTDAARLLSQATFGAKPDELSALMTEHARHKHNPGRAAELWLERQMASPATLLRSHYRARANPRVGFDHDAGVASLLPFAGAVVGPCEAGARWHRFAFDARDVGKQLTVVAVPPSPPPPTAGRTIAFTVKGAGFEWLVESDTVGTVGGAIGTSFPPLHVIVGDTVRFTGSPGSSHWFEMTDPAGLVVAGPTGAGATFDVTFTVKAEGIYSYHCPPHKKCCGMVGTMVATSAAAATGTGADAAIPGHFALYVDGVLRTAVTSFQEVSWGAFSAFAAVNAVPSQKIFTICAFKTEAVGAPISTADGAVELVDGRCPGDSVPSSPPVINPPIEFFGAPDPRVVEVYAGAELTQSPVKTPARTAFSDYPSDDSVYTSAIAPAAAARCVEAERTVAGRSLIGVPESPEPGARIVYYLHDPRLRLLRNTISEPATAASYTSGAACPTVSKSFINAVGCTQRSQDTCAPLEFTAGIEVTLDDTTRRAWYTTSGRLVYKVTGLRLDSDAGLAVMAPPCREGVTSRWIRTRMSSCDLGITMLTGGTAATVAAVIENVEVLGIRPQGDDAEIVDLQLTRIVGSATCSSSSSTIGASVNAGGACWTHSHPDERSVFDFTGWKSRHPGGPDKIAQWAEAGSTELQFPSHHPMERWLTYAGGQSQYIMKLGVSSATVEFAALPPMAQTPAMAEYVGAIEVSSDMLGLEACGSPAEVENDPQLGNQYHFFDNQRSQGMDASNNVEAGKWMVWQNVVHSAPDQLRHRVAWALSQIFVASSVNTADRGLTEAFAGYYDIFVRGAFGNYLDLMREVSASPVMGGYLSFIGNKAFAMSGSYPDENYAREVMQLFSIGLYELNLDGTHRLDPVTGLAMQTYTNADVMAGARVWTGYDREQLRGNVQTTNQDDRSSPNLYDAMILDAELRDRFPKTAVGGGYLGDGFPLCSDLPPQRYLKRGARYKLTGSSSSRGSHFDATQPPTTPQFEIPCVDSANPLSTAPTKCPESGARQYQPTYQIERSATLNERMTGRYTRTAVRIRVKQNNIDLRNDNRYLHVNYELVNTDGSGRSIAISGVVHWSWGGKFLEVLLRGPDVGLEAVNDAFGVGDTIEIRQLDPPAIRPHFAPVRSSSELYAALCDRDPAAGVAARCRFPAEVVLPADLSCDPSSKVECHADTLRSVKVVDGTTVVYYEYVEPDCVRLTFFDGGRVIQNSQSSQDQCADPSTVGIAGNACCSATTGGVISDGGDECLYVAEPMTYTTAEARCAALYPGDGVVCPDLNLGRSQTDGSTIDWQATCAGFQSTWTAQTCTLRVKVFIDGTVNIIDDVVSERLRSDLHPDSSNAFSVRWDGQYPVMTTSQQDGAFLCDAGCTPMPSQSACLCSVSVKESVSIVGRPDAVVPTAAEIRATVPIGAPDPASFGPGVYVRCETAACRASSEVAVHLRSDSVGKNQISFDSSTIFEFLDTPRGHLGRRRSRFVLNRQSTVVVGDPAGGYSFRNPPGFIPNVGEESSGLSPYGEHGRRLPHAVHEADALLQDIHEHPNTAPFVAHRLIQRLVSSNPSPKYVERVATAFRTGAGFSEEYGDLAATIAAVLLDREARSPVLEIDPTYGRLEEPLIKVTRLLRSLSFEARDGLEFNLDKMHLKIGQTAMMSPTVFNFYLPEYAPAGAVASAGMVAPEAQLATAPYTINYLNGIRSLIVNGGLTSCNSGFGERNLYGRTDAVCRSPEQAAATTDGALGFVPTAPSAPAAVVAELEQLLTPGRLSPNSRSVIAEVYESYLADQLVDTSSAVASQSSEARSQGEQLDADRALDDIDECSSTNLLGASVTKFETSPWWQVDFGAIHEITSVTIHSPSGSSIASGNVPFDIIVINSATGAREPCAIGVGNVPTQLGLTAKRIRCRNGLAPATGNIVRIQVNDLTRTRRLSLCEVAVATTVKASTGVYEPQPTAEAAALKHALMLFAMAPDFQSTNLNVATTTPRLPPPSQTSFGRRAKSVVVVFLTGGLDSWQVVVPKAGCRKPGPRGGEPVEHDYFAEWFAERGGAAMALDRTEYLNVSVDPATQPCAQFGLHPSLKRVKALYDQEDVAILANAGVLQEPMTKAEYTSREPDAAAKPPGLFAHNTMQQSVATVHAADRDAHGIIGKMTAALTTAVEAGPQPMKSALYSIQGQQRMLTGASLPASIVDQDNGFSRLEGYDELAPALDALTATSSNSIFAETYASVLTTSLQDSEHYGRGLANDTLAGLSTEFGTDRLSKQLEQVAKLIKFDANDDPANPMERSAFVAEDGGWDSHDTTDIADKLSDVDAALGSFADEMVAQGRWDDVAVVVVSDFGRTLTTNSRGSDHGWGGNYWVMGGEVNGKQMLGTYPARLTEEHSELNIGRGRFIPTTSWEAVWNGIAEWWGIDDPAALAKVMPHLQNFEPNQLFSKAELFK